MPHTIVENEVYRLTVYNRFREQQAINSVKVQFRDSVGLGITDQEAVGLLTLALSPLYAAIMQQDAVFEGCTLRRIQAVDASDQPVTKFQQRTTNGTVVDDVLPLQTCGLISLYTEFGGKARRGRAYLPFPSESQNLATGIPSGAWILNANAIATYFTTTHTLLIGAASVDAHFGTLPAERPFADYKTFRTHGVWATQRRRSDFGQTYPDPFQ